MEKETKVCERCEKDAKELFECEICNMMICENCQAVYDVFTQIDFNCCKSCASRNDD